jgi:hypothetical protein
VKAPVSKEVRNPVRFVLSRGSGDSSYPSAITRPAGRSREIVPSSTCRITKVAVKSLATLPT